MKNIISKYSLFILIFAMVGMTSCGEDFLDLQPTSSVPTDGAIKTVDDLNSALVGAYSQFQNSDYYGRYFVLVPDVMGDDVKQNASANRAKEWAEYNGNQDDFIPEEIWEELYEAINRANTVINSTVEVSSSIQAQKDQLVGEALALRALAHFDLVRIFGQHYGFTSDASHAGVPIITTFDQDAQPARNTVKQVYDAVIADLTTAASMMTINNGSGRMSSGAANAILSRIYLYQENWSAAEQAASAVINSGSYSLTPNGSYLAAWAGTAAPPDAIFDIIMNAVDNNGSDALGRMYINEGYGDYLPSMDFRSIITPGDVRGELFKPDSTLGGGVFGWDRVNKFPSTLGEDNTPVVRYAEVLLNRAEARARQNNATGALEDVNAVRLRGLPTNTALASSGQQLIEDILTERRIELAYEGHRLWDLMRNKQGVTRTDCSSSICSVSYPNDRFILPIPRPEMDANPNMSQNPGY